MIVQVIKIVIDYDVLGQPVNLARLDGIDETQKIVTPVTLSFAEYDGNGEIISEQILADDRYFYYENHLDFVKNIPFADLSAEDISKLNGTSEE